MGFQSKGSGLGKIRASLSPAGSTGRTASQKISPRAANKAGKDGLETLLIPTEEVFGRYSAYDLVKDATGEIYIEAGDELSPENLEKLDQAGIDRLELLDIDHTNTGGWIRNTLKADKAEDRDQALSDSYRVMRILRMPMATSG